MVVYMKKGNTSPILESTLYDGDNVAINLIGASVLFRMWSSSDPVTPVVSAAADIVGDGSTGQVTYSWDAADTTTVGEYSGAFLVTYADTTVESFPISDYLRISVLENASDWTYGRAPGTATASGRRDAVRMLVGDTDLTNQKVYDTEVAFALDESGNDVYRAASIICRSLSAKYADMSDTTVETLRIKFSAWSTRYETLALRMERMSKRYGASGMGIPVAGGIRIAQTDTVLADDDRVAPAFIVGMFEND